MVLPPWKENSRQERSPTEIKATLTSDCISKTNPWNERKGRNCERRALDDLGRQGVTGDFDMCVSQFFWSMPPVSFRLSLYSTLPVFSKGTCWEAFRLSFCVKNYFHPFSFSIVIIPWRETGSYFLSSAWLRSCEEREANVKKMKAFGWCGQDQPYILLLSHCWQSTHKGSQSGHAKLTVGGGYTAGLHSADFSVLSLCQDVCYVEGSIKRSQTLV